MSPVAFIREMLAAGLDIETALMAAEKFEDQAEQERQTMTSQLLDRLSRDEKAEARKAKDRDRKRKTKGGIPRNSVESVELAESDKALSLSVSPEPPSTNPNQNTPLKPPHAAKAPPLPADAFSRFWDAYPAKVAKRAAQTAFPNALRRIRAPDPLGVVLAGIDRAKRSRKWRDGFIPNPATWLNGDCWEDDPDGSLAAASTAQKPPSPEVIASRLRHLADTGEWRPGWGPRPRQPDTPAVQQALSSGTERSDFEASTNHPGVAA